MVQLTYTLGKNVNICTTHGMMPYTWTLLATNFAHLLYKQLNLAHVGVLAYM